MGPTLVINIFTRKSGEIFFPFGYHLPQYCLKNGDSSSLIHGHGQIKGWCLERTLVPRSVHAAGEVRWLGDDGRV